MELPIKPLSVNVIRECTYRESIRKFRSFDQIWFPTWIGMDQLVGVLSSGPAGDYILEESQ